MRKRIAVLASGRVRFVGEPVAMIVAETAAIAEDARELIEIDYRRAAGEHPTAAQYEVRFPGDAELVQVLFSRPPPTAARCAPGARPGPCPGSPRQMNWSGHQTRESVSPSAMLRIYVRNAGFFPRTESYRGPSCPTPPDYRQ